MSNDKCLIARNTKSKMQNLENKHKLQKTVSINNTEYSTLDTSYRTIIKQSSEKD